MLMFGGADLLQLDNETHFYYFTLFFLVLAYLILRMILRAPFGKVIVAIKANEHRVRALGYATNRYKLVSFVIAGTLSGLAGFLEGAHSGYINPSYMSWHESGVCIAIVILGGMGTLYGPIIGAFIIVLLQNFLPEWTEHAQLVLGVIVIAVVLFLPHGVASLPARLINLLRPRTKLPDEAAKEVVDG
jgi:branched-chain amino acid transport system permease protein